MLTRWCSRNSRDFGVVIGAASCPSVLYTLGYWAQKKNPAIPPLSSRTPQYEGVYPGIDLVWYGNQRKLEYDFVVAPGADPKQIQVAYEGVESVGVDAGGDLGLRAALGGGWQQEARGDQGEGGEGGG